MPDQKEKKKKTLFIIFFILIFKIEWWVWRIQQAVSLPKEEVTEAVLPRTSDHNVRIGSY